jgi:hypothetical protein
VEDLSVWQKPLVGKSFLLEIDGSDFPLLNRLDGTPSQTDINGQQSYKEEHDNARYHKLAFIDDKPKEELGIKWDYPLPKGVIKTTHLGNILDFYQPVTNPPAKFKEAWELLRGNAINAMAESCAQAYINSLTKPTIMNKVKETITNLFHTKTDQVLIDHGMENSDGTLTPETQALMLEELAKERWLTKRDEIAKHLIDSSD